MEENRSEDEESVGVESDVYVVSLAGRTPLAAPTTGATVSGKQSQGDSLGNTSPDLAMYRG